MTYLTQVPIPSKEPIFRILDTVISMVKSNNFLLPREQMGWSSTSTGIRTLQIKAVMLEGRSRD